MLSSTLSLCSITVNAIIMRQAIYTPMHMPSGRSYCGGWRDEGSRFSWKKRPIGRSPRGPVDRNLTVKSFSILLLKLLIFLVIFIDENSLLERNLLASPASEMEFGKITLWRIGIEFWAIRIEKISSRKESNKQQQTKLDKNGHKRRGAA